MGDAAGEQSELFEGFGLAPLCLAALTLGDIAKDQNNAGNFVFGVSNRGGDLLDDTLISIARGKGNVFRKVEQNGLSFAAVTTFLRLGLRGKIDRHIED